MQTLEKFQYLQKTLKLSFKVRINTRNFVTKSQKNIPFQKNKVCGLKNVHKFVTKYLRCRRNFR